MESYTAVTSHFINNNWEMCSALLDCIPFEQRHTAENLSQVLKSSLESFKLYDKVGVAVTDSAANMIAAIRLTSIKHIPCFAHVLNTILQNNLAVIFPITNKVRDIVKYFRSSTIACEKLKTVQKQFNKDDTNGKVLKLILDVKTRWNSTYYMFDRIIEIQDSVQAAVGMLGNPVPILTVEEWTVINEIKKILKPFEQVSRELSLEKQISMSMVMVMVNGLFATLERIKKNTKDKLAIEFFDAIYKTLREKFANFEHNSIIARSTFFDPRFKKSFVNENAYKKVKDDIQTEMNRILKSLDEVQEDTGEPSEDEDIPEDDIWYNVQEERKSVKSTASSTSILELRQYNIEEEVISRKSDPLKWWKTREVIYPTLALFPKKYLCVTATSVPSERVFSKGGTIVSEKRNR